MDFRFSEKSNAIEGGIFNILNEKKKDLLNGLGLWFQPFDVCG